MKKIKKVKKINKIKKIKKINKVKKVKKMNKVKRVKKINKVKIVKKISKVKKVKKINKVKRVKKMNNLKKIKTVKGVRMSNRVKRDKTNWKLIAKIEMVIIAILLVSGAFGIYAAVPAVRKAITLATTVQPETFTELYFENHTSLPAKITYNQEEKFKFTVHNLEYKTMTYPYEVYIKCSDVGCNGEKQIIDEGKITLKQNEYKTISESYMISLPMGRVEVVADLINKNQQIDFWTTGEDVSVVAQPSDSPVAVIPISAPIASSTPTPIVSPTPASIVSPMSTPVIIQPQLLSDFYFNYQPALPITVANGQIVSFAFTVHNLENQTVTYPYNVYSEENGQDTQIDNSQFTLQPNEYKTISESYAMSVTPGLLARIYVRLNNENRYIYFEVRGI